MTRPPALLDCLIAGGGPGGSALAYLLARRGWSVAVIHDGRARHASPVETILPAALPALSRCGLADVIRSASEVDTRRHGARWDHIDWVWQPPDRPGFVVARQRLDHALQEAALAQGARWIPGSVARIACGTAEHTVEATVAGETATYRARTVAVATGRRSLRPLLATRTEASGPATAAFALQGNATPEARTLATVEAAPTGWSWWIGHGDGGSGVVVVDLEHVQQVGRERAVMAVLAEALGPARCLRNAPLVGAVRATARAQATDEPVFLLGDAASTLDPLASQGTEKALVSAEAAAVAIDAALQRPEWHTLALQHHARWELELWWAHQRAAQEFYGRVTAFAEEPFWSARRAPQAQPAAQLPARLTRNPSVTEAPALRRVGDQLEVETGIALPGRPALARLGRICVVPIAAAFAQPTTVEAGLARAGQHPALFPCGSAAVRAALHELWLRGYLCAL